MTCAIQLWISRLYDLEDTQLRSNSGQHWVCKSWFRASEKQHKYPSVSLCRVRNNDCKCGASTVKDKDVWEAHSLRTPTEHWFLSFSIYLVWRPSNHFLWSSIYLPSWFPEDTKERCWAQLIQRINSHDMTVHLIKLRSTANKQKDNSKETLWMVFPHHQEILEESRTLLPNPLDQDSRE